MSTEPNAREPRPRRQRGVTESLLSLVLILEAIVVFFATITIRGLTDLPSLTILLGGFGAITVFVIVAGLQRFRAGVVVGGVLQVALLATGLLHPYMYLIGAVFAAMWAWSLVRARRIEKSRQSAAGEGGDA